MKPTLRKRILIVAALRMSGDQSVARLFNKYIPIIIIMLNIGLTSCFGQRDPIIGAWTCARSGNSYEFMQSGDLIAQEAGGKVLVSWKKIRDNQYSVISPAGSFILELNDGQLSVPLMEYTDICKK